MSSSQNGGVATAPILAPHSLREAQAAVRAGRSGRGRSFRTGEAMASSREMFAASVSTAWIWVILAGGALPLTRTVAVCLSSLTAVQSRSTRCS